MSAKNKKGSNLWPKRLERISGRLSLKREESPVILVVCEGSKTEPYYLNDLKRELGLTAMKVVPGNISGTNPKSITDYTKAEFKKMLKEKGVEKENFWCAFDRDDHEYVENALVMARDNGFKVSFSNPCFELWLLLHFQDQNAWINRKDAKRQLKKYIPEYEKSMAGVFARISAHLPAAKKRAEFLRKQNKTADNCETENPSTTADLLVKFLYKAANKDLT